MKRRRFLQAVGGAAVAAPFYQLLSRPDAHAMNGVARRLIVFYFPDGVPGPSEQGNPSLWHGSGSGANFSLPELLGPLERFKSRSLFFNGLDMGRTDEGSHPGGAKKLLTAADNAQNESIDQMLARTVGSSKPHRHVYLGVQSNRDGASGDKHISYIRSGVPAPPEDNPVAAFERLFGDIGRLDGSGASGPERSKLLRDRSVVDGVMGDVRELRGRLGNTEAAKLDLHLEALREIEQRLASLEMQAPMNSCASPQLDDSGYDPDRLYEAGAFPNLLRMQTDIMVQAMACGLTSVGVLQASHHTSELIMSAFMGTDLYDPGFDMRSHQASHYGPNHDQSKREFRDYVTQRRWFLDQFAYLLDELDRRPEGEGTMLEHSLVLLCSEVCDGNTHSHWNMPFVLAGGGSGAVRAGQLIDAEGSRHANLFIALAHAMGERVGHFGWDSSGPLGGVLG